MKKINAKQELPRLLAILGFLSPYSCVKVSYIASELGVSPRVIRRDVKSLQALGVFRDSQNYVKINRDGLQMINRWLMGEI